MPNAPTFEDVWRMFQETDRKFQETDRKFQETDRLFKENALFQKETARQLEETGLKMQETDRQIQATDRQIQKTDRQMQETDRELQEVTRQLGSHGNRLGEFVQEMVRPAVVRLFKSRDLPVHQVMPNVVAYDDDGRFVMEIDLLVINATTAIAVECKSKLTVEDVTEHLERLDQFKACFPQYRDYSLLGAVAGMVLPDEVGRHAYRRGLYVLAQSGDGILLRNDGAFQPRVW
jgi:hypothetical protein